MIILRWIFSSSCLVFLAGCASTQLNYNTLDIAANVEGIYVKQALINLSKTIDNPYAIPSQIDLAAGTVQTSASISPSVNTPLSKAISRSGTGVITGTALAGSGFSLSGSDGFQQSYTVSPITDGNNLRNLRALYRYALFDEADLQREYRPPLVQSKGKYSFDPYALLEPQCVLCTSRLIPNRNLHKAWVYWSPGHMPDTGIETVSLGIWGNHELYMSADAYRRGYLDNFVLFIMGTGAGPADASGAGKGGGGPGAANKRFELIIPQQINPQQQ
jgi:hypothetical protein